MRPRTLLVTAAAVLAATHVTGVLFARPVFRPAELLAALCLLAYAVRYDLLADRRPAPADDVPAGPRPAPTGDVPADGRPAPTGDVPAVRTRPAGWGLTVAAAVLVAGAAVTVPPPPREGAGMWILILSAEEYAALVRRVQLDNLMPVAVALLFVLVLLATVSRWAAACRWAAASPAVVTAGAEGGSAAPPAGGGRERPSRVILGTGIGAAVLIIGYVVLRVAVVTFGATRQPPSSADRTPSVWGLPIAVAVLLPLLLALASLALAVVTAARGKWGAASGAVLHTAATLIFLDSAMGSALMPYAVHGYATVFSLDLIEPTAALPQPMQAMTAALRLAAAILIITGLTRHHAGAAWPPRTDTAG